MTTEIEIDCPSIEIGDRTAVWHDAGRRQEFELLKLPETLSRWQLQSRQTLFSAIERSEPIEFAPSHLPVVATMQANSLIPNLANKGVGLTPLDRHLDAYLHSLEAAIERIEQRPLDSIDETRQLRVDTARSLYSTPEHIDWRRLGLLEIFEGNTFKNILAHPFASILWTGAAPTYLSFQVDCIVEIIRQDDPRYRFSWAMRRLFEYERFHVVQTRFPYAYCFWVIGIRDKTPRTRHPGAPPHTTK